MPNHFGVFCECEFCGNNGEIAVDLDAVLMWPRPSDDRPAIRIQEHADQPVVLFGRSRLLTPCPHLVYLLLDINYSHDGASEARPEDERSFEWLHPWFTEDPSHLDAYYAMWDKLVGPDSPKWSLLTPYKVLQQSTELILEEERPGLPTRFNVSGWAIYADDAKTFLEEVLGNLKAAQREHGLV